MSFFGGGEDLENFKNRYEKLKAQVVEIDAGRKKLATELAAAQQQLVLRSTEIETLKSEIEKSRAAVRKARQRQKNSVERANRFKSKVG